MYNEQTKEKDDTWMGHRAKGMREGDVQPRNGQACGGEEVWEGSGRGENNIVPPLPSLFPLSFLTNTLWPLAAFHFPAAPPVLPRPSRRQPTYHQSP